MKYGYNSKIIAEKAAREGTIVHDLVERYLNGEELLVYPREIVMWSLAYYITHASPSDFQPMKANFGILPDLEGKVKKKEKKEKYAQRALEKMEEFINGWEENFSSLS